MPTVVTVGYGLQTWPEFAPRLAQIRPTHVIDVRTNAYSRYLTDYREGFPALVREQGWIYRHLGPKIGGKPPQPELQTDGEPDWEKVRASEMFRSGLDQLIELIEGNRLALMCGCVHPIKCHRGGLLTPELEARGITVKHQMLDGRILSQAEAIEDANDGQKSLF